MTILVNTLLFLHCSGGARIKTSFMFVYNLIYSSLSWKRQNLEMTCFSETCGCLNLQKNKSVTGYSAFNSCFCASKHFFLIRTKATEAFKVILRQGFPSEAERHNGLITPRKGDLFDT